jgi:glycosyltransferase involved in cell wall biosynthesis
MVSSGNPLNIDEEELKQLLSSFHIAVVIPCYRVEREIEEVLLSMPSYVETIIAVDDASPDGTQEVLQETAKFDSRIVVLRHPENQGVGGAMITGFRHALKLRAQVIVKMDGDGQMNADDLPQLLLPLIEGRADYAKGTRFRDFKMLRQMPWLRRVGNTSLSFLVKAATGYWNCFDPCNGFFGIRHEALAQLPLERIDHRYFFETSMLAQLYLAGAVIRDVPLPARYGTESSNLSITKVLVQFPPKLIQCYVRRIILKKYIYDFTLESLQIAFGVLLLLFGCVYGGANWIRFSSAGVVAPTGTVVIPAMTIILGFQLLLAAVASDLASVPKEPICGGPLRRRKAMSQLCAEQQPGNYV